MTTRAFKPSSLSLRPRRPSIARTNSNSSTQSHQSQDFANLSLTGNSEVEDLVASTFNTGGGWNSPGHSPLPSPSRGKDLTPQRIGRTRPIAIELPQRRPSGPIYTPPEPLSARGDLPGGYFPLHEDISRSYKPHPFHPESSFKLASSLQSPRNQPDPDSPQFTPLGHSISHHAEVMPTLRLPPASESLSINNPAPVGMASPLPLGKYHPSQYKNKSTKLKSSDDSGNSKQHTRSKSDIKRKLQQYQRDMVEQAALAGRIAVPSAKPVSPRLGPLGSPGPVTPMALEEGEGYLVAGLKGRPSLSPGADETSGEGALMDAQDMVRRMIKAEQERDRAFAAERRGKEVED